MKNLIIYNLLLFASLGFSQNLNSYKYALVPSKFSFQKEKGQYNANALVKMITNKNQFESYFDDEVSPADFVNQNCNKVYVDLNVVNSLFVTKVKIIFKDCKNNIIFTSTEGKSRNKDNSMAFLEALRDASYSLDLLRHKYEPTAKELGKIGELASIETKVIQNEKSKLVAKKSEIGYDLYDSENVVMTLKATMLPEVFITNKQNNQGVLIKIDESWFFEYYVNNQKVTENIKIQF